MTGNDLTQNCKKNATSAKTCAQFINTGTVHVVFCKKNRTTELSKVL